MKLASITTEMLQRAIGIYLEHAYKTTEPPYHVLAKTHFENETLDEALESENFEKVETTGEEGTTMRYLLRLGNDRYPHMKLGVTSCVGSDEYVFVVDTHDRHFPVDPRMPGSSEFRELQLYNDHIKREIEEHWQRENLPTMTKVLEDYDRSSCIISRENKTVLIVEDEAHIAELERNILDCAGYNTIVCLSGEEAIEEAERNPKIDLCLLDIMMPDADGFDVVRILEERSLKQFPIVFVTAMPETRVDPRLADGFIAKPFEPHYLLERVRSYIG